MKLFKLLFASTLLVTTMAQADILEDMDSLGGNDVLLEKANALQPDKQVSVVQNRIVDRRFRHEFSPELNYVVGGDAYVQTTNVGLSYNFHITPKFSVGAKYFYSFNELKDEGQNVIDNSGYIPDMDWPKHTYLGMLSYYPFYGKFKFFGNNVVHFDFYMTGGAGQVVLKSGSTMTYAGGGGIGLWLSKHLTSRFEVLYQRYNSARLTGDKTMNVVSLGLSVGYML